MDRLVGRRQQYERPILMVLRDLGVAIKTARTTRVATAEVARAKGMAKIAQAAGLGRERLYKALSKKGNPEFASVLKVMRALGLKLKVTT